MSAEAKDRSVGQEQPSATRQHDVEALRPHAAANGPQAVPALPTLPPALPGIGSFSDRLRQSFTHGEWRRSSRTSPQTIRQSFRTTKLLPTRTGNGMSNFVYSEYHFVYMKPFVLIVSSNQRQE